MAEHTPGPWLVTRGAQDAAFSVEAGAQTVCVVKFIRGKSLSSEGVRQEEANARLIAAAPALLEACETALLARGWFEGDPEGALVEIETRLRAAIALAKPD